MTDRRKEPIMAIAILIGAIPLLLLALAVVVRP